MRARSRPGPRVSADSPTGRGRTAPRVSTRASTRRRTTFHGARQAGITTPAQDRLHFASFDVTTDSREQLVAMLKSWTEAAREMTAGSPVGKAVVAPYDAPPADTGEALGLSAAGLTLTFGFGPTLFEKDGKDRFGLAERQPAQLRELPHFPADNLDPERSNGDLCVQACAHDPQVAVHAIRNLARIGFGTVAMRWAQLGFGRTSSTSTKQVTARNLLGFKDGTSNIKSEERKELEKFVWVREEDDPKATWLAGGSYLVARRIKMQIEPWDRTSMREQEMLIGRNRQEGAPLSGGTEFTEPDFDVQGRDGPADRGRRARAAGPPEAEQRRQDAAPWLQLHRRRHHAGTAGRRAVLHRLRAQPRRAVHPDADPAVRPGRPDGVPPAHRLGPVRGAARRAVEGRLHRRGPVRPT